MVSSGYLYQQSNTSYNIWNKTLSGVESRYSKTHFVFCQVYHQQIDEYWCSNKQLTAQLLVRTEMVFWLPVEEEMFRQHHHKVQEGHEMLRDKVE